jgi:hypothetical protein
MTRKDPMHDEELVPMLIIRVRSATSCSRRVLDEEGTEPFGSDDYGDRGTVIGDTQSRCFELVRNGLLKWCGFPGFELAFLAVH